MTDAAQPLGEREAPIRVVLVDDIPLLRQAVAAVIDADPGLEVVGQADDGLAGLELVQQTRPDVVVLDLEMPVMNGLECAEAVLRSHSGTKVLMLTVNDDDEFLFAALRLGVHGYLLKDMHPTELRQRIRDAVAGQTLLAPALVGRVVDQLRRAPEPAAPATPAPEDALSLRELEILRLAAGGRSNREIGRALCITEGTVKNHMHHALSKLGVENRAQAAGYLLRRGLLPPRPLD